MRKTSFYPKLAFQNIKLNRQFYLPFILTCIATIAMFYIMCFLTMNKGMALMNSGSLGVIFMLGCIVIGLFSVVFLFYTNSFLMKRRQKELGLYNILGMSKGNISTVLFFETLFVAIGSIILGLGLGVLLSKLVLLLLCSILAFPVPFGFEVSVWAVLIVLALFLGIFLLILISNLVRIRLSNPIELLKGGNVGEKEPKTRWILAVLGILALAGGYYIAITVESPLMAIALFFIAVLLVIIGTYLVFTAGSIAVLKRLKAKPNYYYKVRHFIPVSGMIYRMKQNAVGLANICILATMVLVMISGTVCLYLGTADSINARYPKENNLSVSDPRGNLRETLTAEMEQFFADKGVEPKNLVDYEYLILPALRQGDDFGSPDSSYYRDDATTMTAFVSASEHENQGGEGLPLERGEVLAHSERTSLGDSFKIYGKDYSIKTWLDNIAKPGEIASVANVTDSIVFVLNDEDYADILARQTQQEIQWCYGFDLEGTVAEKQEISDAFSNLVYNYNHDDPAGGFRSLRAEIRETEKSFFYELTGGFLFLGLFLGIIFIMATALIIYYKQLSEGYDDRERFEIMQKVGLSKDEIKKAIHSQILLVFFLPLGMAVIHIAFAFPIITRLLTAFSLTNVSLFLSCTIGTVLLFALIYWAVYAITAKVYYKIVSR